MIDGTLSSLDSRVSKRIIQEINSGDIFKDKIVLMVTYDLDQAEQMDYVLMLNPDGTQQCCMPANEFFMKADLQELRQIEHLAVEETEYVSNDEEAMKKKGIVKTEGKEEHNPSYRLIFKYFGLASKIFLGPFSLFIVIFLHILINVATSSLSFYLAI